MSYTNIPIITRSTITKGIQHLRNNGIEREEAENVLQALYYTLFNEEAESDFEES